MYCGNNEVLLISHSSVDKVEGDASPSPQQLSSTVICPSLTAILPRDTDGSVFENRNTALYYLLLGTCSWRTINPEHEYIYRLSTTVVDGLNTSSILAHVASKPHRGKFWWRAIKIKWGKLIKLSLNMWQRRTAAEHRFLPNTLSRSREEKQLTAGISQMQQQQTKGKLP